MRKVPPEVLISIVLIIMAGFLFIGIGTLLINVLKGQDLLMVFTSISFGLFLLILSAFLWMEHDEARVVSIIVHSLMLILSPIPFLYSVPRMWRICGLRGLIISLSLVLPIAHSLSIIYLLTRPRLSSYMRRVKAPPLV